ncbi:hypothetical protein OG612_43460 (plasmid) [Streptomyces sp. NBC_01527]|uniref:hypothetical protein n=1 Tax=unclassified Streptomyces TaxID=2593676 RepID=UPI002E1099C3|nr:hypothetical protein OG763_44760 [Streptomyces sp. NBC_01230]
MDDKAFIVKDPEKLTKAMKAIDAVSGSFLVLATQAQNAVSEIDAAFNGDKDQDESKNQAKESAKKFGDAAGSMARAQASIADRVGEMQNTLIRIDADAKRMSKSVSGTSPHAPKTR